MTNHPNQNSAAKAAMQELKPCPFCGGPVELENTINSRSWWGVVCRNTRNRGGTCAIQTRPSASKEVAIERWNMRAPVADERAAGINPDECDAEVYKRGTSVGLFAIPKEDANAICAGIAAATGARVDWHYIAGRVHIKALPALASAPVAGEATYYAVMHGNALYGIFDTEAAAEARKAQGHPDAPFSVKPLYAAPQASAQNVRNADAAMAAEYQQWIDWFHKGRDYDSFLKECVFNKPQADKDGGQQPKRYVVLKASGSRYAYVNDTQEGRSINRFDVLKGDGWKYAHEFADRMNKEHERAALSATQAEQGERDA